jgi:superfamily II DNA or RNA helicase
MTLEQIIGGLVVRHLKQPEKVGVLTGNTTLGIVAMAEVQWGDETLFEPVGILEEFKANRDQSFESMVREGRFGKLESVRSLMTFEKLRGDLSNIVYSMRTAEIDFYPHQFLPVLKYVNSPLSRLLIADEVGLGKTIEASLIWTECQARYGARRLLVICPPTLIPKWIRELQDRFAIEAQAVDAKGLLEHYRRLERKGAGYSFALVTSYHALRPRGGERGLLKPWIDGNFETRARELPEVTDKQARPALIKGLTEWNLKHCFADLVVFDEAHLMKNTATASHAVGKVFSSSSQGVVALSATPLTTKTRDLYALMRLVDPDMFRDENTFNSLLGRNRSAVRLANAISKTPLDVDLCLELLANIPASIARTHLQQSLGLYSAAAQPSTSERVVLWGKAQRLNELGAFLNRTRKMEVVGEKVIRHSLTLDVRPSKEEVALYNGLLRLIRRKVKEGGDALSVFHLIGPALAMSSCLPVIAARMREGKSRWGDLNEVIAIEGAFGDDEESESSDFVGEDPASLMDDLKWLPDYDFEAHDSKYAQLLKGIMKHAPREKVIIFAFFKATLGYLQRRLEQDGIRCLLVTGDTTDRSDRDKLLRSFESPEHRVLLCSEVAAEGVDLQFCRIIVNYDLPWNPMRVEQRIGRIDRIGQLAKTIQIINFNVRGTIDGSIYEHLHSKIGVFKDTVGDLEDIMGEHINKLTKSLLIDVLSPEEAEQRIIQTAQAIEQQRAINKRLDEESDSLIGLRSLLQTSVAKGETLGRYIKASELRRFTSEFFQEAYSGSNLSILNWDTPAEDCLTLQLSHAAISDFDAFLRRTEVGWPRGFDRSSRSALLTFSPERHEKLKRTHRKLLLVNHLHPFIQWVTLTRKDEVKAWHPACASTLNTNQFKAGDYLMLIMRLSLRHPVMSRNELLFRAISLKTGKALDPDDSEELVNQLLEDGRSAAYTSYPDHSRAFAGLVDLLNSDCRSKQESFAEELELRVNSKRAQITNHFNNAIETAQRRLANMQVPGNPDMNKKGIQLARNQIEANTKRLAEELGSLAGGQDVVPQFKRLACGLVKVLPIQRT